MKNALGFGATFGTITFLFFSQEALSSESYPSLAQAELEGGFTEDVRTRPGRVRQRKPRRNREVRVEDVGQYADEKTEEDFARPTGTGLSLFVGFDLGVVTSSPKDPEAESEKSGYQYGFKGLGSVFTNSMVLDFGGGYLVSHIEGDLDTIEETDTGNQRIVENVVIDTRIGYFEFSPRFRLADNFSAGLIGHALYGEDGSFGPANPKDDPNAELTDSNLATVFAGLTLVYEDVGESAAFRIGGQVLTDVNIFERQILIGAVSIQVGFPIIKQKTIYKREKLHKFRDRIEEQEVEKVVVKEVVKEVVKFQFDSQYINFETDKSELSRNSKIFMRELARFLMANPASWGALNVDGHTDIRGSYEYNMELSRDRAASVRSELIRNGVPQSRIRSSGYGYTRPIDKRNIPVAWARNRRVEMTFSEVRNPLLLKKGIENIRRKMSSLK